MFCNFISAGVTVLSTVHVYKTSDRLASLPSTLQYLYVVFPHVGLSKAGRVRREGRKEGERRERRR